MNKLHEISKFSKLIRRQSNDDENIFKGDYGPSLKIYQNNYLFSLLDTLKNKYQIVLKLLGDENFNFFAREYIYLTPSKNSNIDQYGSSFGEFLESKKELSEMGYIKYIAELDNYWFQLYEGSDATIELPIGVLKLWGKLKNDEELDGIEIDEEKCEVVYFIVENSEYQLITKTK